MLGTGAITVLDESVSVVDVTRRLTRFFVHESCGRCTPCRVGNQRILEILQRIVDGKGREGDIELLLSLCDGVATNTFCPMGDAAVNPVRSSIARFRDEYEYYIKHKKSPVAS
jgi:NADH:ubiquinone oxidoreductase subunit F (NADH-binding)